MAKPLDQFGGWLRFFQIVALLNFLLMLFSIGMGLFMLVTGTEFAGVTAPRLAGSTIFGIVYAFALAKLFINIPVQDSGSPRVLFRWAWFAIAIDLISAFVDASLLMSADSALSFFDAIEWPRSGLWLLMFPVYIQTSKRVKAFYGTNYPDRSSDPHIKDPIEDMIEGWRKRPGKDQ